MANGGFFSIVETRSYTESIAGLGLSVRQVDEALMAVTWALSRDPYQFEEVSPDLFAVETRPHQGCPALVIVYSVDEDEGLVQLEAIGTPNSN